MLGSQGIDEPVRATILSESLGSGPIQRVTAQLSLLPNMSAVIQNESFQVLGVFPSIVSQGKSKGYRRILLSYGH